MILIIIFFIFEHTYGSKIQVDCPYYYQNQIISFDNFSDLLFTCDFDASSDFEFTFVPNKRLLFFDGIDFNNKLKNNNPVIDIYLISAFNIKTPFLKNVDFHVNIYLYIVYFYFYSIKETLYQKCENSFIYDNIRLFKNISLIVEYSWYLPDNCPLLFTNSSLTYFEISYMANTWVVKNYFGFKKMDKNESRYINMDSLINKYQIRVYYLDIDKKLMDEYVFKKLSGLSLIGLAKSIDPLFFKPFKHLKNLLINFDSIKKFLYKSKDWLENLNFDLQPTNKTNFAFDLAKNYNQIILIRLYLGYDNSFENEDFVYSLDFRTIALCILNYIS